MIQQLIFSSLLLKTDAPIWFILVCFLVGAVYSYLLYSKKTTWSKNTNRLLAIFRFALVSLLCFLLMGPLLNQISFFDEKPVVVVAIDNSASIPATYDSLEFLAIKGRLTALANGISSEGYQVRFKNLQDYQNNLESVQFDQNATNLQSLLKGIASDYEQQNLIGVVLASDGIHNYGLSPQFTQLNYPVISIALGDTIPAKDLSLKSLSYNKVVYEGNRFPLVAEIYNNGFLDETVRVQVLKKGKVIDEKSIDLKGDEQINSVEFILDAELKGIETYQVQIVPKKGENSVLNNGRKAFLEVVDSKQRILIAAKAPHPDIKALKNVIAKNEGTETVTYIVGYDSDIPEGPFDLIILHELPDLAGFPSWLNAWLKNTNTFYISGSGMLSAINDKNPVLNFNSFGQTDNAGPNFNSNFELFEVDQTLIKRMAEYPPVAVPYGQFTFKTKADILLYQRVGSVQTNRPLLSIYNGDDQKSAVFSGAGFWKWPLQEYAFNNDQKLFETLMGKLIQYLTTKEDKRKFRVNTEQNRYFDNEAVTFETDIYNELFERVFDINVDLRMIDAQGTQQEYNYVNNAVNDFKITGLATGIYSYTASADVNGKRETSKGTFSVDKLDLEDINLTANHQLLKNISANSGGRFVAEDQMSTVVDYFKTLNAKPITRSDEKLQSIINNPWLLLILLALVSSEWFIRKYNGSY